MILELRAIDFKDTDFGNPCNCAISKAAKKKFKAKEVSEGITDITIEGIVYNHEFYGTDEYYSDKHKAASHNYDNTVIRTIELTKV